MHDALSDTIVCSKHKDKMCLQAQYRTNTEYYILSKKKTEKDKPVIIEKLTKINSLSIYIFTLSGILSLQQLIHILLPSCSTTLQSTIPYIAHQMFNN